MSPFSFKTDAKSEQYCREIVDILVTTYGLSRGKALRLLNRGWGYQDFVGERDLRYHKGGPEAWAKHIFIHWRR